MLRYTATLAYLTVHAGSSTSRLFQASSSFSLTSTNNSSKPNHNLLAFANMSATLIDKMTAKGSGEQAGKCWHVLELS